MVDPNVECWTFLRYYTFSIDIQRLIHRSIFRRRKFYTFPKKVGIVFLERRKREAPDDSDKSTSKKDSDQLSFGFDQDASSYFLLEMNQRQKTFEFQVVDIKAQIPKGEHKESLLQWLDHVDTKIQMKEIYLFLDSPPLSLQMPLAEGINPV